MTIHTLSNNKFIAKVADGDEVQLPNVLTSNEDLFLIIQSEDDADEITITPYSGQYIEDSLISITKTNAANGLKLVKNDSKGWSFLTGFDLNNEYPGQMAIAAAESYDQDLNTTDSPTFDGLTLSNPLSTSDGGTGVNHSAIANAVLIETSQALTANSPSVIYTYQSLTITLPPIADCVDGQAFSFKASGGPLVIATDAGDGPVLESLTPGAAAGASVTLSATGGAEYGVFHTVRLRKNWTYSGGALADQWFWDSTRDFNVDQLTSGNVVEDSVAIHIADGSTEFTLTENSPGIQKFDMTGGNAHCLINTASTAIGKTFLIETIGTPNAYLDVLFSGAGTESSSIEGGGYGFNSNDGRIQIAGVGGFALVKKVAATKWLILAIQNSATSFKWGAQSVGDTTLVKEHPSFIFAGYGADVSLVLDSVANVGTKIFWIKNVSIYTSPKVVTVTPTNAGELLDTYKQVDSFKIYASETVGFLCDGGGHWSIIGRVADRIKILKSSDETVTNSAVLQDDNTLLFPISAISGEAWEFEIYLTYTDASNGTADLKATMTGPTASTISWFAQYLDTSDAVTADIFTKLSKDTTIAAGGSTTERVVLIKGTAVSGGTAGSVKLQWAQNTQDNSDLKIKANSNLIANLLY